MYGVFKYIYHQNQPKVGKYTSPMDHMGFRLFLHANDLGEIFLQFISFFPFRADSVQESTMFFYSVNRSVRPETSPSELKGFTSTSIHPFTHQPALESGKPTLPPHSKTNRPETLEDIFGQLQHHFTRQGVSGKERLPGNPGL